MKALRPAVVAGQFYPADPNQLRQQLKTFLSQAATPAVSGQLKALIVPHAGYLFSGPVAAVGYRLAGQHWPSASHLFLLGSSHRFPLDRPVLARFTHWQTPLGEVRVKNRLADQLAFFDEAHLYEHSLEVQLPFLQVVLSDFTITPILLNQPENAPELAQLISNSIDKSDFIVVSSDLSHYYPYDQAVKIDALANQSIPALDIKTVESDEVEACGKPAILTLLHLAKQKGWQGQLLDYKNSGDTAGDKTQVVGYGCYGFFQKRR